MQRELHIPPLNSPECRREPEVKCWKISWPIYKIMLKPDKFQSLTGQRFSCKATKTRNDFTYHVISDVDPGVLLAT